MKQKTDLFRPGSLLAHHHRSDHNMRLVGLHPLSASYYRVLSQYHFYCSGYYTSQINQWSQVILAYDKNIILMLCDTAVNVPYLIFNLLFWDDSAHNIVERNIIINGDRGIGFGLGSSGNDGGI